MPHRRRLPLKHSAGWVGTAYDGAIRVVIAGVDGVRHAVASSSAERPSAATCSAPSGALATSTLPPVLARTLDAFELYDPTTMPPEEQDKVVGAIVAGFAVVFPLLYLKVAP